MQNITIDVVITNYVMPLKSNNCIQDALEVMAEHAISSVVITDEQNFPIGIFTERDALNVVAKNIDISTLIKEVMSQNLFCIQESMHLHDAYILLENRGYRHLIAVNKDGLYVGIISEGDFLRQMGFEHIATSKNVQHAMSEAPLMIDSQTLITRAAKMMSEQRCNCAIVIHNKQAKTMLNERDIAYCCMHENFSNKAIVGSMKHSDMQPVLKSMSLKEAATMMEEHGTHQLVVVDDSNNVIGILNRNNILKAIHDAYFNFLVDLIDKKNADLTAVDDNKKLLRERNKREDALKQKESDLNEAQALAHVGSWSLDVTNSILKCSDECYRIFNIEISTELDYESFLKAIHPDDRDNVKQAWNAALQGSLYKIDHRIIIGETIKWVRERARLQVDTDNKLVSAVGTVQDITKRKLYEEELERLANFDSLTGLANRSFLLSHLQKSIHMATRNDRTIALLLFDLDHFKDVNDSFGHSTGDELLKIVTVRFVERIRKGDLIARLGGDEFALVLEHISRKEDAAQVASEMIEVLSQPYQLSNKLEIHIGASVGIVIAPQHSDSAQKLLQYADTALYKAKSEGRSTFAYYSDELTKAARDRIMCENRLRRAMDNCEFELYYQPQVHMKTGRIIGAEALIRWNDPEFGMISPDKFIPLAEETGLISDIGEWVLFEACKQGKRWLDNGHNLHISVNVSAHQIHHQDLSKLLDNVLRESGFNAEKLTLELTESAMMRREEEVVAMLHALRAKGIRLAIDDFGTGYSSYSYLKRFPIDILKIDKSFIDDIPYESDDMAIVKAIIAMGTAMGYQILAEGIEQIEQLEFLKEHECTYYQGYYKSRPLPPCEFEKLL